MAGSEAFAAVAVKIFYAASGPAFCVSGLTFDVVTANDDAKLAYKRDLVIKGVKKSQ